MQFIPVTAGIYSCDSRHISYYHKCWNQLCNSIFL